MKISVNELKKYAEKEIVFSGFIDAIRDKKWVMFVILRDAFFCFSTLFHFMLLLHQLLLPSTVCHIV